MWRLVYYRTARGERPVRDFVDALPLNRQRKVGVLLQMLSQDGPRLGRPYADHVRGPLRELRVQFARNEYRIFHYFTVGELVVLLHGFVKKTDKLPVREIETAEQRMEDFEARLTRGELME